MERTTLDGIKRFLTYQIATDITGYSFEKANSLKESENGFDTLFYSCGKYGINGALLQGHNTGNFYTILARTSVLFQLV